MTLYEIKGSMLKVIELWDNLYDEETGEIKPYKLKEAEELQNYVQNMLEEKSNGIVQYFRNIDASIKALKEEEDRLSKRRKSLEKQKQSFRDYVVTNLKQMGIDKVKTEFGTMYTTTSTSVKIDEKFAPKNPLFWKEVVKVENKFDKDVLKKLIIDGEEIPGVHLSQSTSLVVR